MQDPQPRSPRRLRERFQVFAVCIALSTSMGSVAHATAMAAPTASEARQSQAELRYQSGVRAYAEGRYNEAVERFLEADAVLPSAALSYNTALAYENLLDAAGALRFYRDFLRRAPTANNAEQVRKRVIELEAKLASRGVQQVTVRSDPAGATVLIDGRPAGVTPWTGELAPGVYDMTLDLKGYAGTRRRLQLALERALDVNMVLAADSEPPPNANAVPVVTEAPTAKDASREKQGRSFGPWPYLTLGAGGAALAAAGVFELLRRDAQNDARHESVQIARAERLDSMESHQLTARILGVTGGALVVTGAALWLFAPSGEAGRPEHATLACGARGCYGSVKAKF